MRKRFGGLMAIFLMAMLGMTACGGDGSDEDAGAGTEADNGTCAASSLVGTWKGEAITFSFDASLAFHAVGAESGTYEVDGSGALEGCTLSLTDGTGLNPCPADQVGEYRIAFPKDGALRMTAIGDACEGRLAALNGKTFTRQ